MMTEIGFYHLTRTDVSAALPALLQRTLAAGERALILCATQPQLTALDSSLWTAADWLPHGTPATPHPEWQPIFLTTDPAENPNEAAFLFTLNGAATDPSPFRRAFDLFDGRSDEETAAARTRWSAAKSAGHSLTYWQQTEAGWQKK
jgi:DNA polymerase-3 subunit chi